MPESYIVLSAKKAVNVPRTRSIFGAAPADGQPGFKSIESIEPSSVNVSFEKLDPGKAERLRKDNPEVLSVTPVMPLRLITPKDKKKKEGTTGGIAWGIQAVGADKSTFTGKDVKVAVLDTGIHRAHPCFNGIDIIEEDFTNDGNGDIDGHGTHVAGTIFGKDTFGTRIAVAPGISQALIAKVIGRNGGDSGSIVKAINWALGKGANVICMSLGIDFPGYVAELVADNWKVEAATSIALEGYRKNVLLFEDIAELVKTSALAGVNEPALLFAASGNESDHPHYKISVSPPAVSEGFVSVGALGQRGDGWELASFSNVGPSLSAPGVDILSADLQNGLTELSGTSMATPHVAGVAALWVQKMKEMRRFTAEQLKTNLIYNAEINGIHRYNIEDFGAGMVQAPLR
ncbi:S8 family serine peptidase [Chitinophaga sp.]|uniref:S8 family peptidase n=1 Tax=Chitinophaga sp. TaxID=1869181 RepID=UPI00261E51BE|nr:S8 family serine peptidase [uncultured Chitinophaga sp.]